MIKVLNEDKYRVEKVKYLRKLHSSINELFSDYVDYEEHFGTNDETANLIIKLKRKFEQEVSQAEDDMAKNGAGSNY